MTFTTHRKPRLRSTLNIIKNGSMVYRKCQQLVDELLKVFPDGVIEDEDLTYFIERFAGTDRETVRAYKGYSGHVRAGRCGDNTIVGLSRKGYLEKFFFMSRKGRRWVIPIQAKLSSQAKESSQVEFGSNDALSLFWGRG